MELHHLTEYPSSKLLAYSVTSLCLVPTGYNVSPEKGLIIASGDLKGRPLDMLTFATFLYENEAETGPLLALPEQFTDEE